MAVNELLVASLVIAVGSLVQGSIGLGLGLLSTPILVLVEPELVPGPILFVAMLLTFAVAWRERASLDLVGIGWALTGRIPGIAAAGLAAAYLPRHGLNVTLGCLVLIGVVMTASPWWKAAPTKPILFSASVVSGFMGTIASIGGPPMALVLQRSSGPNLRANLSGYFTMGSAMSLIGLVIFGEFGVLELRNGLRLIPAMLVGLLLAAPAARVIDRGRTRIGVLALSGASAVVLLVREIVF